jgi:hypothetical protein
LQRHDAIAAGGDPVGEGVHVTHAVVRRHLVAGQMILKSADSIVEDCAKALISGG